MLSLHLRAAALSQKTEVVFNSEAFYADGQTVPQLGLNRWTCSVAPPPPPCPTTQDEIYDMVSPVDPLCITFEDLQRSKMGPTVLFMLVDVNGFWQYDHRESLMQQKEAEDADAGM